MRNSQSRKSRAVGSASRGAAVRNAPANPNVPANGTSLAVDFPLAVVLLGAIAAAFAWSYWGTLRDMVHAWNTVPDYSHGYLVAPLAAFFIWVRRDRFPGWAGRLSWFGLIVLGGALLLRYLATLFYLDSVTAWSIPVWVAGVIWLFGGWPVVKWALPSLAFLYFMFPLPFRLETSLSVPLQKVATSLSTWMLHCLGQPVIAEGNVLRINHAVLEVAQACSGLRIFMSLFALAFAYAVLLKKPWWMKASLFVAIVPIALVVNALRITFTGLMHVWVSDEWARVFSHDAAGLAMIPVAAILLGLFIWYLGLLIVEERTVEARDLLRRDRLGLMG